MVPVFIAALLASPPPAYVTIGMTTAVPGVPRDELLFAGSLEVGDEVTPHLALHARGIAGEYLSLFGPYGSHTSLRAGADATSCDDRGKLCGFAGLEAGYAASRELGPDAPDRSGAIGVLRAGADIRVLYSLRWRPIIEVSASRHGVDDVELTQALAVHF